jgi:hypothetical protein
MHLMHVIRRRRPSEYTHFAYSGARIEHTQTRGGYIRDGVESRIINDKLSQLRGYCPFSTIPAPGRRRPSLSIPIPLLPTRSLGTFWSPPPNSRTARASRTGPVLFTTDILQRSGLFPSNSKVTGVD